MFYRGLAHDMMMFEAHRPVSSFLKVLWAELCIFTIYIPRPLKPLKNDDTGPCGSGWFGPVCSIIMRFGRWFGVVCGNSTGPCLEVYTIVKQFE